MNTRIMDVREMPSGYHRYALTALLVDETKINDYGLDRGDRVPEGAVIERVAAQWTEGGIILAPFRASGPKFVVIVAHDGVPLSWHRL